MPIASTQSPAQPAAPPPEPSAGPASNRSHRTTFVVIAVAAAVLVVASIVGIATHHLSGGTTWAGTLDDPSFAKPEFTLTDTSGQPYDFAKETKGQVTLLYFGYTHCPDFCPITMATIAGALNDLPGKAVKVVFVTTDPNRDTPAVLRSWLGKYDAEFVGLTGTQAQLAAAQKAAGVSVAIADKPDAEGNYQVGHAASVLAYTPDGRQHLSYPYGTTQSDWVHDLPQIFGQSAWMRTAGATQG